MKIKVLTYASNKTDGLNNLIFSLEKFGWDYEVMEGEWKGFGTKLIATYHKCKELKEQGYTHFIFVDAYDTFFLGTEEELIKKYDVINGFMLISAERGCYPDAELRNHKRYNETHAGWDFVNSGTYLSPIDEYMLMFEENTPDYSDDDQRWLTARYLSDKYATRLDKNYGIFQCHSFIREGDYTYTNRRVQNLLTGQEPIIIHANGRSPIAEVYNLLA